MAEVELSRRAVKDLDAMPVRAARHVVAALELLAADPEDRSLDVKRLAGRPPWRRLRVGQYRVLFRMAQRGAMVLVGRVIDRRDLEQAVRSLP